MRVWTKNGFPLSEIHRHTVKMVNIGNRHNRANDEATISNHRFVTRA